jgi:Chaperone of endosialidase
MATDDEAATERITQLRGVTWDRREDAPEDAKEQPGIGVIAQEVEKVFPELVTTDEQGRKKVE